MTSTDDADVARLTAFVARLGGGHAARIFHRRQVGQLFFFDALMVDPSSQESFLVELVTCHDRDRSRDGFQTQLMSEKDAEMALKDLHVGDVVELLTFHARPELPRAPCQLALQVHRLKLLEPWVQLVGKMEKRDWMGTKYAFHRPVFHDAINQSWFDTLDQLHLLKRDEKRQKAGDGRGRYEGEGQAEENCERAATPNRMDRATAHLAEASHWETTRRQPKALVQCHLPQAQRLADYLNGKILSTCTRDRLVMLYHSEQEPERAGPKSIFDARHAKVLEVNEAQPCHLQSVIQRVYFVDARRKAISLRDVCAQYLTELLGPAPVPSGSLWEQLRRRRNFMCFPGELESALKSTVDASPWHSTANGANGYATTPETKDVLLDGLQLPKDRCDSIVYADGLFWWSANVPRAIIPAKDNRSVPSSAYWKLLEILDRYEPSDHHDSSGSRRDSKALWERFSKRRLALDVGASPGGWSYCLATQLCIQRTIACDPVRDEFVQDFTEEERKEDRKHLEHRAAWEQGPSDEHGRISHWRMRGADALDQLSSQKLSIFVCDMNDALEASCQLLYRIAREGLYEPPCLAVVTFKNTCRSKTEFEERKRAMLAQIRADRILTDVQEIHLFANTRLETTIVGQML
ncbi:unnamed protein product [Durusdinium trenchii]|uniref:Uncharacterized protein n=2 Tax=Durusdinium trenchii TaxID=1381693 RepID=A0ABP0PF14_9DINO